MVFELRPHWKAVVGAAVLLPVVAFVGAFGAAALPAGSYRPAARAVICGLALLLLARWALRPWLRWLSTRVIVTTDRVMLRRGVLSRSGRDIDLRWVRDVTFHRRFSERALGCGTLIVDSVPELGSVAVVDVPAVEAVARDVLRLARTAAGRAPARVYAGWR